MIVAYRVVLDNGDLHTAIAHCYTDIQLALN